MAFDSFPALEFLLSMGRDIAIGVISSYIYDKLKRSPKGRVRATINRRVVEFDEGTIRRVIEEEIQTSDSRLPLDRI
jgi:hypothetical protein